jgi:hypothetical protein
VRSRVRDPELLWLCDEFKAVLLDRASECRVTRHVTPDDSLNAAPEGNAESLNEDAPALAESLNVKPEQHRTADGQFDRKAYMQDYMRDYNARKKAKRVGSAS